MLLMNREDIVALDKAHVWHPYTAMDEYIARTDPLVVARAEGATLFDLDGRSYLDANSSWYTAALGHGHPRLVRALGEQAASLAHCSLAGTTHEQAARLADELCAVAPRGSAGDTGRLERVFFTDNGSTSIEVAVKIAVQTWRQLGAPGKSRFLALEGAYHGDTVGAASLGGVEVFRRPFGSVLFDCVRVPSPAEGGHARAFEALERALLAEAGTVAAVVIEPMVQATAGMRVYDSAYLASLRDLCTRLDVLLVADEVFTGYGRTGPMWACQHAGIAPDVMCVGKAFAAMLPMGATLVTDRVFDAFRGGKERALYYGHTFCGNPLGARLAREVLAIFRDEDVLGQVARKERVIAEAFARLGSIPGVARIRSLGMIGAADLVSDASGGGYLGELGWRVYAEARKRGAYLRPLGDTIYVCPPLTIADAELEALVAIVDESVRAALAA
jgi:adenosylmethionine-8-amino-7-oxononanoate aminotransferase